MSCCPVWCWPSGPSAGSRTSPSSAGSSAGPNATTCRPRAGGLAIGVRRGGARTRAHRTGRTPADATRGLSRRRGGYDGRPWRGWWRRCGVVSFDLFVWHEGAPISADEAGSKLDRWTDGETDVFRSHPAVSMFRDAILTRFPPPENHGADSVWSVTPAPSDSIAALSCTWSRADEVG